AAAGGQDQREGEVGGRLGQHAGRVGHGDAARGGGRDVDVVIADGDVGEHLDRVIELGDDVGAELVGELADDALLAPAALEQCLGRQALAAVVVVELDPLAQVVDSLRVDKLSNEDGGHRGTAIVS